MKTIAADFATIYHALLTLENEFLGPNRTWRGIDDLQEVLIRDFIWARPWISKLQNIKAKASRDSGQLNQFLAENRMDPMFTPFDGIGVASVLDMLVKWANKNPELVDFRGINGKFYPGFKFQSYGYQAYRIPGYTTPLVSVDTETGDKVWLLMPEVPFFFPHIGEAKELEFILGAGIFSIMREMDQGMPTVPVMLSSITIPKVDFNLQPDIRFVELLETTDESGAAWEIDHAMQQIRFRMDERGARAMAATGMVAKYTCALAPSLIFDRPFYCWMTQKDNPVPLAMMFVDFDSWRQPDGSLEDL